MSHVGVRIDLRPHSGATRLSSVVLGILALAGFGSTAPVLIALVNGFAGSSLIVCIFRR